MSNQTAEYPLPPVPPPRSVEEQESLAYKLAIIAYSRTYLMTEQEQELQSTPLRGDSMTKENAGNHETAPMPPQMPMQGGMYYGPPGHQAPQNPYGADHFPPQMPPQGMPPYMMGQPYMVPPPPQGYMPYQGQYVPGMSAPPQGMPNYGAPMPQAMPYPVEAPSEMADPMQHPAPVPFDSSSAQMPQQQPASASTPSDSMSQQDSASTPSDSSSTQMPQQDSASAPSDSSSTQMPQQDSASDLSVDTKGDGGADSAAKSDSYNLPVMPDLHAKQDTSHAPDSRSSVPPKEPISNSAPHYAPAKPQATPAYVSNGAIPHAQVEAEAKQAYDLNYRANSNAPYGAGACASTAGAAAVKARKNKWHDNLSLHILFVGIISVLLLIPSLFFSFVLEDRESNERYAINSMVSSWASKQVLTDIELIVPVVQLHSVVHEDSGRSKRNFKRENLYVSAEYQNTSFTIDSMKRYRGNYEATLYTTNVQIEGEIALGQRIVEIGHRTDVDTIDLDGLDVVFSISDPRGIDEIQSLKINGIEYEARPSKDYNGFEVSLSGEDVSRLIEAYKDSARGEETSDFYAEMKRAREQQKDDESIALASRAKRGELSEQEHKSEIERAMAKGHLHVDAIFSVRGSESISYVHSAKVSELSVSGKGSLPLFTGAFLPKERELNEGDLSFSAYYYQNNLSTGRPVISDDHVDSDSNYIEIELQDTSSAYTYINRLTKYVLLFIAMTYVTVMAFEIVMARMVSLVQYVVIGAALILFYLVLLSLSEHISFSSSYMIGSLVMSSMIALYIKAMFESKKSAVCIFVMLLAMYAVLFAIVHIEAYALLVGTALLVIMLGIVMYITRKINILGFGLDAFGSRK